MGMFVAVGVCVVRGGVKVKPCVLTILYIYGAL